MEPRHERIAKIALGAGARYGLALAGGYAVSAHGMGNRPSGDVDLFTSWQHRGEFPELKAAVIAALESAGYKASVIVSAETFTRLTLTDPADGAEEKLELSVDWRAHDPVQLAIGPVLHADDAVANKVCALFGRALPRDFLDVDAAISSGRYTREQLLGNKLWEIGPFKDTKASQAEFRHLQRETYVRYEDLPLETSAGKEVFLRGDSTVQYQDLMNVIDALKAAGVQNIGMVARMPSQR